MDVYNLMGQKIRSLADKTQEAGIYSYNFSATASGYGSGIYLLKVNINDRERNYKLAEMGGE